MLCNWIQTMVKQSQVHEVGEAPPQDEAQLPEAQQRDRQKPDGQSLQGRVSGVGTPGPTPAG